MNQKEINELRRRFRHGKTSITHVYGCYVNNKLEIISRIDASLGMIPQEEAELYLDRLRKALGGSLGKNLIDVLFSAEQVNDSADTSPVLPPASGQGGIAVPDHPGSLFVFVLYFFGFHVSSSCPTSFFFYFTIF